MSGAMPPLPHYALMARCSVKAQGQLYLYLYRGSGQKVFTFIAVPVVDRLSPSCYQSN